MLKQNRVTQIATENNLPMIGLVQSVRMPPATTTFLATSTLTIHPLGRRFPASAIQSIPQRRTNLPRPGHPKRPREAQLHHRLRLFDRRRRISSSHVRLYHLRREPSPGLSRRPASGQDGHWRNRRCGDSGRSKDACYDYGTCGSDCDR